MTRNLVAAVMAGGSGTRLWPLSTPECPKQFQGFFGDETLLQSSVSRLSGLIPHEKILILTSASCLERARAQLPQIPADNFIGEGIGRDTAAAVSLAAFYAEKKFPNSTLLILPSDHWITPVAKFQAAISDLAAVLNQHDRIYTLGIKPSYPATGYGYLHCGKMDRTVSKKMKHFNLRAFVEKPKLPRAKRMLASGEYFWNSGIFAWRIERLLSEIHRHLPKHFSSLSTLSLEELRKPEGNRAILSKLPKISIDYAVLEKVTYLYMVKADFSWSDLGNWPSLAPFLKKDGAKNAFRGGAHFLKSKGNLVFSADEDVEILLLGVSDLVVVRTPKRVLVSSRKDLEALKNLTLKKSKGA